MIIIFDFIQDDIKRLKRQVSDLKKDLEKARDITRWIIEENGKTSHSPIWNIWQYQIYKMRHKVPSIKEVSKWYRIYYLSDKRYSIFVPVFVYIRSEGFSSSFNLSIIKQRLKNSEYVK